MARRTVWLGTGRRPEAVVVAAFHGDAATGVEAASARRDREGESGEGNRESGFRILTNFGRI